MAMTWTPPSRKAAQKLPAIEIAETNQVQTYLDWLDGNPGIPRTVPPLFRDFAVRFSRSYFSPERGDKEPRKFEYEEVVHYEDDLARLWVSHSIDGRKVLMVSSEYVQYDGVTVRATVTAPHTTPYTEEWLQREGVAALYTVLAVQAYILYHRPEVVPVELAEPPRNRGASPARTPGRKPVKTIGGTVRKIIRLSAADPAPPMERHYKAIQWNVRGHYRRLTRKDGTPYLAYVKPHLAKRGEAKAAANTYRLTAAPKKEDEND